MTGHSLAHEITNVVWHIEPEWRALFAREQIPALFAADRAHLVKYGRFRNTFRTQIDALGIHIKQCRPIGFRAWMREWLRPAKALLEFRKIREVAARGTPTLEAIGWGQARGPWPGDSFLITRSRDDAEPLGEYLTNRLAEFSEPLRSRRRQQLAVGLGRFLADLHCAGVFHPDLHPGNLLISWHHEEPQFVLLDLHDVVTRRSVSRRDCLANMVLFNRWFVMRASRTDRLRFWRAYSQVVRQRTNTLQDDDEGIACRLEQRTWSSNLRFWRSRMRRCLGTNRYFRKLRTPGVRGFALRGVDPAALAEILHDADCPFRGSQHLLKDSRSSTVAAVGMRYDGIPKDVIYKRFRVTSLWDGPLNLLRTSACLRSWRNGHGFLDCMLPTPRPIAVWQRRRFGMDWEGYLLVEKIEDACDLHAFLHAVQSLPSPRRDETLRDRVEMLARAIRQMHERGWTHRDLKATNILVTRPGTPIRPSISFIDLVGVRRPWYLTQHRRLRDLARLNASFWNSPSLSRTDRLRFLRSYMQWNLKGRRNWKLWWRQISDLTAKKQARNCLRGRPLA